MPSCLSSGEISARGRDCVAKIVCYRWSNGRNITPGKFNLFLKKALADFPGYPGGLQITSHCFRAGVVTLLGQLGAAPELIKTVGRWSSEAWRGYCKEGRGVRLADQRHIAELTKNFRGFKTVQVLEDETGAM